MKKNILQYLTYVLLLIFSLIVVISGIIKFPGLLNILGIDNFSIPFGLFTFLHDWVGIGLTLVSIAHIVLNWKWIQGMTMRLFKRSLFVPLSWIGVISVLFVLYLLYSSSQTMNKEIETMKTEPTISNGLEKKEYETPLDNTRSTEENKIHIDEIGTFYFDPVDIVTVRPDIFNKGYFSVFDVLVHLDETDQLKMEYEYSKEIRTHIINEINGVENWWYQAYYDGGWAERNVWRMDLFPYKDRMTIQIIQIDELSLFNIYEVFLRDSQRRNSQVNNLKIPKIVIRGESLEISFENIEVKSHNLRNDFLVEGTITAIDAILTLGDMGLISNSIKWYESIGSAGVVKNYFVDEINGEKSVGRCGFVYEIGEKEYLGFRGNHIHIPSDIRVIDTIPEYIEYFWICI
jgi:hypothetical protein